MVSRINKILNSQQLLAVLKQVFKNRPVKILRIIAATGRSQVSWIHIENTVSGRRLASFISFKDLITGFWHWLEVLELFALAAWELSNIATCVWNLVAVGDTVFDRQTNRQGTIVEKNSNKPRSQNKLWIDWGERIKAEDAAYIFAA